MKINMRMKWKTTKGLPEELLLELWEFLKDIKNNFEIDTSLNSISVPLFSKKCNTQMEKEWVCALREKILRQLEKKEKVLKILTKSKKNTDFIHVKIDKDKFNSFYRKVENETEKLNLKKPQEGAEPKLLITRDNWGDFYYRNKPIKFENNDTIYYLIFECLYEKGDLNGFCSYATINKYLEEHGKEKLTDDQQIKDRIKNGIVNLFRFSKLPPKAPNKKPLIQKVRGKGVVLYNPSI